MDPSKSVIQAKTLREMPKTKSSMVSIYVILEIYEQFYDQNIYILYQFSICIKQIRLHNVMLSCKEKAYNMEYEIRCNW